MSHRNEVLWNLQFAARDSPLPNKLNEIKGKSNIMCNSVVSTKLSLESLVLSFVELLAYDPVYGDVEKFIYHIGATSSLLIMVGILLNLSKSSFIELLFDRDNFSKKKVSRPSI